MNETERMLFWGRALLYFFLVGWGFRFLAGNPNADVVLYSFMHNVNLPIHEAGHIVFAPLGWFMGVLGGTLMQILVPLAFVITFLTKYRNEFGSAVTLWWLAQNFMDISDSKWFVVYIFGHILQHSIALRVVNPQSHSLYRSCERAHFLIFRSMLSLRWA